MKKLFTRSLLAFALLCLTLSGYAQKNVLCEDFESEKLPTGWTTTGSSWLFQNSEAQFSSMLENGADTLITPLVSVADLKNHPTVTLDYRLQATQARVNTITVLYRTAMGDKWEVLTTLDKVQADTKRIYCPLPATVVANVQVAVAAEYHAGGATAVGRLAIENQREATEAPAKFATEELTSASVTLTWDVNMSDYWLQNNLKVSTSPIADFTAKADIFDGNVMSNYYDLTNLQPNTQYYAYVRYECEGNDFSPWAELSFKTPCLSVKVPYSENFEDGISDCYTIVKNSRKAGVSNAYPHNGVNAFQFLSSKNTYNYLFFPALDVDKIQDYQVTFYIASEVAGTSYSRDLTIGVASSATAADFQELKTISLPQGRQWERVTVSLTGYKGNGKVLAFRAGNATLENHIFIDDVVIEKAEACPRPMFVTISNVTYNSARISWLEAGNASEWNVVIATKPYADPADCEADAAKGEYAGSVTTNPYEAANLQPQTTYYVYVQSACAEGNWTEAASFTTGKPVTLPYKEGFDRFDPDFYTNKYTAVPEQWVTGSRGLAQSLSHNYDKEDDADQASYISTTADHTGSAYVPAALVLRGTSNSGYYWTSYAMMPAMPVEVNRLMLSFYARTNSKDTRLVIGIADVQSNEIEQGKQLALGGNVTPVDTLKFKASSTWEEFNINLAKYAGKGRYITFYTDPGASTPGIYIDDISIDYAPTCFAVQDLAAEATSTTSFKATWTEMLNATSWNIKVSSSEIDPATTDGDIVKKATVNDTPEYVATGLTPNTTYYVYVSPACGELWASTTVTTLYALTVPYYNDFSTEPTGSGKRPNYWITGNMGQSTSNSYKPYVYTSAPSVASGFSTPAEVVKPYLYFNAYYSSTAKNAALQPYAILPELANANAKDVTLSFWGITTTTTKTAQRLLYIGVVSDPTDMTTLEEVTSVELDTAKVWQYFIVNLSAYTGTGKYIVLYMDNQTTTTTNFYVDNLNISLTANPQRVTDVQVIDSTITETSAKLKWHENGDAKSWKIRLFTVEQTDPSAETPVKEFTANDTIFDLTGLTHSTGYYVYVQAVKGAEAGMWSLVHSFWTKTGIWSVPFYEDFEGYVTGGTKNNTLPPFYDLSASSVDNFPYVYSTYSSYGGGETDATKKKLFYMVATKTGLKSQIVLPKFDKPVNTLQMTFLAGAYSSYIKEQAAAQIGVVTADGVFHMVAENQVPAAKTWYEWFVDFSSYTGDDGQIAIQIAYNETAKKGVQFVLDNISVVEIPQCKRIATVSAEEITSSAALVSWKAAGEETAWNLKVASKPLASPSDSTADAFDGQVTSVSKALENLQPNTTYYVYVQSVRADKDCVGEWSQAFSFTTLCLPVALPYTEDFEGYDSEMIPDCYTLSGDVQDKTAAGVGTLSWYKDKVLKIKQVDVANKNYCAFPLVECKDASELQLRMLVMPATYGTAGDPIEKCSKYFYEVGVMTNPNDPATYVTMFTDSVVADGTTIGKDKCYSFAQYAGDEMGVKGKYITIKALPYKSSASKEYSGSIYVDEVKIERIASCVPPTELQVVEFDNDTVNLTWKAADKKGTFRIRIFDKANANPDVDTPAKDVTVQDTTTAIIRGLNGNTIYFAFVRKECSASDHSTWSHYATWHTDCDDIQAVPYVETFEACTSGQVPNCWSQITDTYTDNSRGQCSGTSTASISVGGSATDGMYLNITYGDAGCSKKGAAKAITPRLDIASLKDIVLYFDAKTNSSKSNVTLLIEAVESPALDAAAIAITTIKDLQYDKWQTYYLDLAEYYESAQPYQYLRFTPSVGSVQMDNIHITTDKSEVIPVQALTVLSLADTTMSFSFAEVTPSVKQWMVEYGPKGFAAGSGSRLIVDTTMVTLTGLTPKTAYDVYVRANMDKATSSEKLTFTTVLPAASIPYHYGFEDANENENLWTLVNTNAAGKAYINQFAFADASLVEATGKTALYIRHEDVPGYSVTGDALDHCYDYAVRYIEFPAVGTYTVGVRAKNYGNMEESRDDDDFFVVSLAPSTIQPVGQSLKRMDGSSGSPTSTREAYNEFNVIPKIYREADFKDFTGKVVISTPGTYQLLLYWQNYSFGVAGPTPVIDSVWVEEYLCTEPSDHKLTAISDNSATLTWFAGSNTQFEVIVSRYAKSQRPEDFEAVDKIVHETFEGKPTYTVNGLKPNTSYAIYQRTICSDGPTAWHEVDFTTNCVEQSLPFTELFAETPMCWNLSSGVRADVALYRTEEMKEADEDAEEWNCLYMPIGSYVVLPDFGVEANRLAIQMNVFNGQYLTNFEIGVVTSPYDMESFQSMQTIKTQYKIGTSSSAGNPYVVESFDVMLHRYKGIGHYIAIKADAAQVCRIKDLTVTLLPECVAPQLVEVTHVTETTAQLNWIAGNETEWMVALNADTFAITENPYVLTNLEHGADYTVSMRAHCDETHASAWTTPVKFTTKCGVHTMPMIENFEGLASSKDDVMLPLNCWEQKYTTITLDSLIKRANAKAFTNVESNTAAAMKWVIPYQSVFDRYWEGVPHMRSDVWTDKSDVRYNYKWLFSPVYKIEDNTTLTFDLAIGTLMRRTMHTTVSDTTKVQMGTLNVAVTKDGVHFTKVQTIDLMQYDSAFQTVPVDLSQFAGDTLMVVLNHGMRYSSSVFNYPSIRINSMRMNCSAPYALTDDACQGYDYTDNGFHIAHANLAPAGESKTFSRIATNPGNDCDSLITITLTTLPSFEQVIRDTICEGESYMLGGKLLTESSPEGQPYKWVGATSLGCDSTILLHLTVTKRVYTDLGKATIKQGETYTDDHFAGLTQEGMYYDTLQSHLTGCDSILTFRLFVTQPHSMIIDTAVCENDLPFTWKGQEITGAGIYSETIPGEAYDSIVRLDVQVHTRSYLTRDENICDGDSMLFDGQYLRAAGTYMQTLTNAQGCDSIITLNLSVTKIDTILVDTVVLTTALPFTFEGKELLGKDTEPGIYERQLEIAPTTDEACKVVFKLHIEVKLPQAVTNIEVGSLDLYPSVISAGQSVNLVLDHAQLSGDVVVEICDMVGKRVATYHPTTTRVVLSDFRAAGIYLVRVTSDSDVIGIGRVLVK